MRIVSLGLFILYFSLPVFPVDRGNFKTCNESGFCKRQRNFQSEANYFVNPKSVKVFKNKVEAELVHSETNIIWLLEVSKLANRSFRVKINEKDAPRKRYEIPVGDSLEKEPVLESMQVSRGGDKAGSVDMNSYILRGSRGEHAVLHLNPFQIDFFLDKVPLCVMNHNGLMNLEHQRTKEAPKEGDDSQATAGTAEETAATTASKNEQLTDAWEETFKSHTDTKPYGPMSVGVDFTFPGFSNAFGIPAHSDNLRLKDTTGLEPYRLYNLDVFEYELDNTMALYGAVPLMWAVNANYTAGLFWHNPSETWIDVQYVHQGSGTLSKLWRTITGKESTTTDNSDPASVKTHWFSETGVIDVFVILANSPAEASQAYGALTGATPLPPLFAIAYHQCRWNYNDQADVLGVDENFDKYDIPYDVIWLDIEHTDGKRYFTWDKSKFPSPDSMVDTLHGKSRKLVTVIDPHIKRDDSWELFKEARQGNLFIKKSDGTSDYDGWCWPGSSSWLDFMDSSVRQWWANRFLNYEGGRRPDNTFTWNDMGEPSVFNGPEVTMHKDAVHIGNWEHRDVHNMFGMQIHRASWEGQLLRSQNLERPFVLTRSFFAGSQRYGAVWTGDNAAQWSHLKASVPMLLSHSVAGITMIGADVGGFFGNPDTELLTRWYQAGAYQPFFRAHAHLDTKRREPWLLPKESMLIVREAIRQRYQLLPYWYTVFYLSETSNAPVMAPLWFEFPKDESTYAMDDEYMIGASLLVKPVTEAGATEVKVYLPEGRWYYQYGWQPVEGGQWHSVSVDINSIPVFYRGGHIVPRRDRVRRSSLLSRSDPFTLIVCLDSAGQAHGQLYVDDGHSYLYRSASEFLHVAFHYENHSLKVTRMNPAARVPSLLQSVRVERIIVTGLTIAPTKVTAKSFGQSPRNLEAKYLSQNQLLIVRKPDVLLAEDWVIKFYSDAVQHQEL